MSESRREATAACFSHLIPVGACRVADMFRGSKPRVPPVTPCVPFVIHVSPVAMRQQFVRAILGCILVQSPWSARRSHSGPAQPPLDLDCVATANGPKA